MATRFNSHLFSKTNYGQPALKSGYGSDLSPNTHLEPCGLEDVDVAMFNLFDKELTLQVKNNTSQFQKVPIIFASGEKWAMLKRGALLRDKNNSLILPLITIIRTSCQQSSDADISGRGVNQHFGELIVQRKLAPEDRQYQNLINRVGIKNQPNVSDTNGTANPQLSTERTIEELTDEGITEQGGFLATNKQKNVTETIVIPAPQFMTVQYEITLWTQYTQHMNQIVEHLLSSFLPQTKGWRLETTKGYWFMAFVGDDWSSDTNAEDMSGDERLIKQKFSVTVQSYLIGASAPGAPIPVKRYLSAPEIEFGVCLSATSAPSEAIIDAPFLGSDDPTLPSNIGSERRRADNRKTGTERLFVQNNSTVTNPNDPAKSRAVYKKLTTNSGKTKYARINAQGETVFSCNDIATVGGLLDIETFVSGS